MAQISTVFLKSVRLDPDKFRPPAVVERNEPPPEEAGPERDQAMAMMAERRWPEAARLFRIVLARAPEPALWMQYGHALKEAGFLEEAGVAYARAQDAGGATVDTHVQLGHWNKITGRFNAAAEHYGMAEQHGDASSETRQELRTMLDPLRRVMRSATDEARDDTQLFFSCIAGPVSANPGPQRLGRANYSYGFAMRGFQRAADDLGLGWAYLDAPHYVPDARRLSRKRRPVHIAFYPWPRARILKGAYNILAFAWEFDTVPDERNWAHAFSKPGDMLGLFDEIWVPSRHAVEVVARYTGRPVSFVPSPVLPPSGRRNPNRQFRAPRRSTTAALREVQQVEWVPLSVFPRLQPNFNNHAMARRRRTREILCEYVNGRTPVVYLSVFNPHDRRKQIRPMVEGFMKFSRHVPEAVLLLKTASPDDTNHSINGRLLTHQFVDEGELLRPLVSDRIWISNAALTEAEMSALYALSTHYLCTSYAEGQNLPLLEAMSEGVIPISVCHTAMADYISPKNAVVIPDRTVDAPPVLKETYRLWGQSVRAVTADDVCQALQTAHRLAPSATERLSQQAVVTVCERYGSAVLENAFAKVLPRLT